MGKVKTTDYIYRIIGELEYNSSQDIQRSFKNGCEMGVRLASWSRRAYTVDQIIHLVKKVYVTRRVDSTTYRVGVLWGVCQVMEDENVEGYDYTINSQHLRSLGLYVPGDIYTAPRQVM